MLTFSTALWFVRTSWTVTHIVNIVVVVVFVVANAFVVVVFGVANIFVVDVEIFFPALSSVPTSWRMVAVSG